MDAKSSLQNMSDGGQMKLSGDTVLIMRNGNVIGSFSRSQLKDGVGVSYLGGRPQLIPDPNAKYEWNQPNYNKSTTTTVTVVNTPSPTTGTKEPKITNVVVDEPVITKEGSGYGGGQVPDGGGQGKKSEEDSLSITEYLVYSSSGIILGALVGYLISPDNYYIIVGSAAVGGVLVLVGKNLISKI